MAVVLRKNFGSLVGNGLLVPVRSNSECNYGMDITINPFSIIPNGSIYTIVPYGAPFAHAQKQQYAATQLDPATLVSMEE
jgi:hypothetical protein